MESKSKVIIEKRTQKIYDLYREFLIVEFMLFLLARK